MGELSELRTVLTSRTKVQERNNCRQFSFNSKPIIMIRICKDKKPTVGVIFNYRWTLINFSETNNSGIRNEISVVNKFLC